MNFEYFVKLTPSEDSGFVVTCADLPQLITQGESVNDALIAASDALEEVLAGFMIRELKIPVSKLNDGLSISVSPMFAVKLAFYICFIDGGLTKSELAKRLGIDEKEVRRMLDPKYPSKLPRLAKGIAVFGKRLQISLD